MGGTALGFQSIRLDAPIYNEFTMALLDGLYSNNDNMTFDLIPAYLNKPSFGDADICVMSDLESWKSFVDKLKETHAHFIDTGNNRDHFSCSVGYTPFMDSTQIFQVDYILTGNCQECHDIALHYYSNNDLGNLIGKIARRVGFKYGLDGLTYDVYDENRPTQKIKTVIVSQDVDSIYSFLGFHHVQTVFTELEDIFKYVSSSNLFYPKMYQLEELSSAQRIRDRKRTTYQEFLMWLERNQRRFNNNELNEEQLDLLRKQYYNLALKTWGDFAKKVANVREQQYRKDFQSQFFNGDIASNLTGLTGSKLGKLMQAIKTDNEMNEYLSYPVPNKDLIERQILEIASRLYPDEVIMFNGYSVAMIKQLSNATEQCLIEELLKCQNK